jgi:hypothetical protein
MVRKSRETAQTEDTVTEINTEATEAQDENTATEAEAGTTEGGHTFNQGDEATVIRGKLRGRKGTILKHNPTAETYAVELEDGTLAVVNAKNLKAPQDSTISVRALVTVLAGFGQSAGSPDHDAAVRIAAMLDEVSPGTSVKLNEALAG